MFDTSCGFRSSRLIICGCDYRPSLFGRFIKINI